MNQEVTIMTHPEQIGKVIVRTILIFVVNRKNSVITVIANEYIQGF